MANTLDEHAGLDTYSRSRLIGGRKAIWEPYADGQVWILTRGVDFPPEMDLNALRFSAYGWGRYRGRKVSCHKLDDDQMSVFFAPSVPQEGP